jgi:8-oxo-dGTP pyrophosphatase MutT (NUDIX family)
MTPTDEESYQRLHRDARDLLESWQHPDPTQQALRDDYLMFLDMHPDAMTRDCRVGHLTASALVLDESRTRVLLTLHPKVGRWLQLGGHHEVEDVSVREAARREAREESGISVVEISTTPLRLDRHGVPCGGRPSEHLDVQFLAWVPDDSVAVMSEESDDLRWYPLDALPDGLDASVLALIADARGGMSGR